MTEAAERWDERYGGLGEIGPGEVAPFLTSVAHHLPVTGTALDVGGGLGANARWLAGRGLRTTLLDVSEVGLELARSLDGDAGAGTGLEYLHCDVEADGLPAGRRWDVVLFHLFYDRRVVESADPAGRDRDFLSSGTIELRGSWQSTASSWQWEIGR